MFLLPQTTFFRPAYEVFEDDQLYEEFLDDVDVVAHSPLSQKGKKGSSSV
jgi:hypothetical protein